MRRSIEICDCAECTANAIALTHEALETWRPTTEESKAEANKAIECMSQDGIAELVRACLRVMHEKTEIAIFEKNKQALN
jgi:hypothetical protein